LPQIQAGRLKALAITSVKRNATLPNVPTMAEAGWPGFESETWFALLAPTGTPTAIIDRLNTTVERIMRLPDIQKTLAMQGAITRSATPPQMDAYIKSEIAKYTKLIDESGITVD
jgi:tripartite-type tricarboxylate transporter receptor subunit TctC